MAVQKKKILIVDDDAGVLKSAQMLLKQHFSSVETEQYAQKIQHHLKKNYDAVLLDMNFRKGNNEGNEGLFWLKEIKKANPATAVILITAYADITLAVEAMKQGATDFVVKPWKNNHLLQTISKAFKKKTKASTEREQKNITDNIPIVGESAEMKQLFQIVEKVQITDANILILGENGTGKGLLAKKIHQHSHRNAKPFVAVDLGAISESLFESELFGHEKGAFTDAKAARTGYFEQANGGTLFLDEIGNLPLHLQIKLLHVLQQKEIRKVGSSKVIPIDVRVLSATNAPLLQNVEQGLFRQDLLYRINTVTLEIPPLRKRRKDIALLIDYFNTFYAKKYDKPKVLFLEKVLDELTQLPWRGNVRELQHAMERAVIMAENEEISSTALFKSDYSAQVRSSLKTDMTLDEMEKRYIEEVLQKNKGNVTQTASDLGLTRTALYRRLNKHGLQ